MPPESKTRPKVQRVQEVKVRMYRHGLGDCFLLTFARKEEPYHMLVDCGVIVGTPNAEGKMREVVQNIKEATGNHIHLLVATHQHWDHLSGFLQVREAFDDPEMKIDSVWLAWTEDPSNELARELREGRKKKHQAFCMALDRLAARSQDPQDKFSQYGQGIRQMIEFFGVDNQGNLLSTSGSMRTQEAMEYVATLADVRYCHPKKKVPMTVEGLEGVRFYVLGPPEDEKLLKRSNPRKRGREVYDLAPTVTLDDSFFAAYLREEQRVEEADSSHKPDTLLFPFERHYRISLADAEERNDKPWGKFFMERYFSQEGSWRKIDDDWIAVAGELALALDSDTNNTSLALAIELVESGQVLLFPADAQVGNWLSWGELSWTVEDENGDEETITAQDLLERTVLYKVGHHGSHNATLREKGLELMDSPDLIAMIPVNKVTATNKHWKMPFDSLLKRLKEKTRGRVIVADETLPAWEQVQQFGLSKRDWQKFEKNVELPQSGLYVELRIKNNG